MVKSLEYTTSSGNLWADFNFPDADTAKVKAGIVIDIDQHLLRTGLNIEDAAESIGVPADEFDEILQGNVRSIPIESLIEYARQLDVHITRVDSQNRVVESSGNVYADLGLPDADEMLAKSEIVGRLRQDINERNLSINLAAVLAGLSESELERILAGQFSTDTREELEQYQRKLITTIQMVSDAARLVSTAIAAMPWKEIMVSYNRAIDELKVSIGRVVNNAMSFMAKTNLFLSVSPDDRSVAEFRVEHFSATEMYEHPELVNLFDVTSVEGITDSEIMVLRRKLLAHSETEAATSPERLLRAG
ncbi:MAG: XRE family transcriptional regulator [Thermomicrobiales bacterium]